MIQRFAAHGVTPPGHPADPALARRKRECVRSLKNAGGRNGSLGNTRLWRGQRQIGLTGTVPVVSRTVTRRDVLARLKAGTSGGRL